MRLDLFCMMFLVGGLWCRQSAQFSEKETMAIQQTEEKNPAKEKKRIALTFDDGPHPEYTPKMLDLLKEKKVKATFFYWDNRRNSILIL